MRSTVQIATLAAALFATGGCSRSDSSEQQAPANESAAVPGAATNDSAVTSANASNEAPTGQVSSGMPVPGTNTPEHVVVNSDSGNGADNSG